jgi:uncharacterized protein
MTAPVLTEEITMRSRFVDTVTEHRGPGGTVSGRHLHPADRRTVREGGSTRVGSSAMSGSAVDRVLAAAGVQFAYLFGSRATGRHRSISDADIAIMPGQPLDLLAEASLADQLAQALQVPAVDLVDLRRAPLRLLGRILAESRLLYSADEPARVAFEVRTRSEYFDFLPTQRAHRDQFLRRVAVRGLDG